MTLAVDAAGDAVVLLRATVGPAMVATAERADGLAVTEPLTTAGPATVTRANCADGFMRLLYKILLYSSISSFDAHVVIIVEPDVVTT